MADEQVTPEQTETPDAAPEPIDFRVFARIVGMKVHITKYTSYGIKAGEEPFRVKYMTSWKQPGRVLIDGVGVTIEDAVEHYLNQIRGQTLVVEVDNYNESPWTRVIMNVPVPEGIMFDRSLSDEDTPYPEYGRRMDGSEIRATRVHPHTPVAPPAAPAERTARGPYGYQHGWD